MITDSGIALLRLSPLVLSMTLLVNRIAQYFALSTFLPPYTTSRTQHDAARVFQVWVREVVGRIWFGVIGLVLLQRIALAANVFVRVEEMEGSHARLLYIIGLVLSFAHLTVAKSMLGYENEMKNPQTQPLKSLECLRQWLRVNNVRVLVVDVPMAFVCLGAVTELMSLWTRVERKVI